MSPYGAYDYSGSGYAGDYGLSRYEGSSWSSVPPGGGGYLGGSSAAKSRSVGYSSSMAPQALSGGGGRNKIFVGRLPSEATTDDLRHYFGNFGRVLDVFLPKDPKKKGHRGFAFVTFTDGGPAERVCRRAHELLGHEIAVDHASPPDEVGPGDGYSGGGSGVLGGNAGSAYSGSSYRSSLDYHSAWGGGSHGGGVGPMLDADRAPRADLRYRPY